MGNIELTDKDRGEIDWWCRHYKEGIAYLTYRMIQYFEAVDASDKKSVDQLEKIIRASLPYYLEESKV